MTASDPIEYQEDVEVLLWRDACLAAELLALLVREGRFDQARLLVKAKAGPARIAWLDIVTQALPTDIRLRTVPTGISIERLIGGLDLPATLAAGRTVAAKGLLCEADGQVIKLPMADLIESETLSQLTASLDSGEVRVERDGLSRVEPARFAMIAFDESEPDDDGVNDALSDRMTMHVKLEPVSHKTARPLATTDIGSSTEATISEEMTSQLCQTAIGFGLNSLRPAIQAVELAKAHCRLHGRSAVTEEDVAVAIRLGLLHRATRLPQASDTEQKPAPPETEDDEGNSDSIEDETNSDSALPEDMVLDAANASLPAGILEHLKSELERSGVRSKSGRHGTKRSSNKRGRPLASRSGELRQGKRLDLIATLRAAVPWQKLRNPGTGESRRIHIRSRDFRIRQFKQHSETSTIFVVDASGSTALNRLAETKGAIEILLAESYVRRDHVSLVCFRGREAEVLLPPTRALVRAKKSLASLPGGGGTPLASGLASALLLAEAERGRGRKPTVVLMTDGSANVDASGKGGRKQAMEDAENAGLSLAAADITTVLVDIGRQPQERARNLARLMNATYVPMPFANSATLSDTVRTYL